MNSNTKATDINKIKSAKEQLISGISLYFHNGSAVSIHTLVCAAHEILDELCKHKGLQRGVVFEGLKLIPKEKQKLFLSKINESRNFFKHANSDPEKILNWNPRLSESFMLDAITLYRRLSGDKMTYEMFVFFVWYRIHNPNVWEPNTSIDPFLSSARTEFSSMDKSVYYSMLLDQLNNGGLKPPPNVISA